jgi:hypothetical protein
VNASVPVTAVEVRHGARRATLAIVDGRPSLDLRVDDASLLRVSLGVTVDGIDLGSDAEVTGSTEASVHEEWHAAFGKAAGIRKVDHRELTVTLRTGAVEWAVIVRVAPDGFAFRYRLPDSATRLGAEHTRVAVSDDSRVWTLAYQTWYETPRFGADLRDLAPGEYGFPLLAEVSRGAFVLISESDIDGRSSGSHATFDGEAFTVTPADAELDVAGGHLTPWRAALAGTLPEIVASTLVDDLAPAASPSAAAARPGRAAWSWWSSQYSGAYLDVQKRFTDFAAEQGWEHVLVDCGWDPAWVPDLVAYASARGIQVHLWSAWNDLDGEENLRKLALWRSWGVAGIKVDFMESEAQERYRWYDAIIAETARVGLAVNFHGSVIPRGWARTHPHVTTYEGIRGAEYYVFYGDPLTAAHNVIQPFTRNVVGSMDYTPVTFSAPHRETSDAHELALGVVYESGITHFADDPDEYRSRPLAAGFLAEIPPRWDEVRLLDGHPDSHALVARRSADRWFVGCIAAAPDETVMTFDPVALVGSPADVWTIRDADGALTEATTTGVLDSVELHLEPHGGFVTIVAPTGTALRRAAARPVLTAPRAGHRTVVLTGDEVAVETDATRVRVPPGWTAARTGASEWVVRPAARPPAGDLAVLTLETDGDDGVPVVTHVRVVTPLTGGPHDLSTMPFLSARNAVGPVERGAANGGGDPHDGGPLQVQGHVFVDGLGVSQDSAVEFAIPGTATRLTGSVAIDDETPDASAVAEILVDGASRARFALAGSTEPLGFELDVAGARVLVLRTYNDSAEEAHVDWLTLRLSE